MRANTLPNRLVELLRREGLTVEDPGTSTVPRSILSVWADGVDRAVAVVSSSVVAVWYVYETGSHQYEYPLSTSSDRLASDIAGWMHDGVLPGMEGDHAAP